MRLSSPVDNIIHRLESIAKDAPARGATDEALHQTYKSGPSTSDDRKAYLLQEAQGLILITDTSRFQKVILPKMVAPGVLLASQDDNLQEPSPVSLDPQELGKFVIALGSLEDVLAAKFLYLSDTTFNPANTAPPDGSEQPDNLGFPFGEDPVFVLLPVIFPFGHGDTLPDSLDLTQPLPAWVAQLAPQIRLWIRGMWWLHKFNDSRSLHAHERLFKMSEIPTASFTTQGLAFVESAWSRCQTEPHGAPTTVQYKRKFQEARKVLAQAIHEANPAAFEVAAAAPAVPGALTQEANLRAVASAVASVFEKSKQESAAGESTMAQEAVDFYRIFFARRVKLVQQDGSVAQTLDFPTLSEAFTDVLKETKSNVAVRRLHRAWKQWRGTWDPRSMVSWQTLSHYDVEVWQNAAVVALKHLVWTDRSLNFHPGDTKNKLSLFHFGTADPQDPGLLAHKAANCKATMEDLVGEDKTKMTKKKIDLYLPKLFSTFGHLSVMIANFIAFCAFAVGEFKLEEPPLLVELLSVAITRFTEPDAKDWMAYAGHTHMPVSIAVELDRVVQCVTQVALRPDHIKAIRAGTPLDPLIFSPVISLHQRLFNKIEVAITEGTLGEFRDPPQYAKSIDSTHSSPSGKRAADSSRPPQSSKKTKNEATTQGLFVFSKAGKPPPLPFKMKDPRGKLRAVCTNFAFVGHACGRRDCTLLHITKRNLQVHPQLGQVKTWVRDSSEVNFAPGAEPQDG